MKFYFQSQVQSKHWSMEEHSRSFWMKMWIGKAHHVGLEKFINDTGWEEAGYKLVYM